MNTAELLATWNKVRTEMIAELPEDKRKWSNASLSPARLPAEYQTYLEGLYASDAMDEVATGLDRKEKFVRWAITHQMAWRPIVDEAVFNFHNTLANLGRDCKDKPSTKYYQPA